MNYWHIQMNQPDGRGEGKIDSAELLNLDEPVIGTGKWDDLQCRYFTGEDSRGIKIGDIVLVREGKKAIALCKVTSDCFEDDDLTEEFIHTYFRNVEILEWVNGIDNFPQVQGTLQTLRNTETDSYKMVDKLYGKILKKHSMDKYINTLQYKKQIILQGPPGTGKTYTAKDLAEQMIFGEISENKKDQKEKLEKTGQFELVQFHPSYTYEDFVRGIVAESNGTTIEYKTVNKVLGKFAENACQNFVNSQKQPEELSIENWIDQQFSKMIELLQSELEEKDTIKLTQKVYIYQIEEECFRYKGDDWTTSGRLNFLDIKKLIFKVIKSKKSELEISESDSIHAWYRQSYYKALIKYFFEKSGAYSVNKAQKQEDLKNYVLLIDEINRANLPAVLGELIYALEYRGESVESMYELDGNRNRSIIVPPNLYIIGTMNTADRSVGHIDYAIRRRFAFVDVLPSPDVIDQVIPDDNLRDKAKRLYNKVENLFVAKIDDDDSALKFLAPDFKARQVQLGHSYFLADTEEQLKLKLEYEIKPILKEYVNDGILIDEAGKMIENLQLKDAEILGTL